jgi:hypothetical protein
MALKLVNKKVVNVNPPSRLTKKQLENIANRPVDNERIQRALKTMQNVGVSRRKIIGL